MNVDNNFNQLRKEGVIHNDVAVNPLQLGVESTPQKVEEDSAQNATKIINQVNAQSET